MRVKTKLHFWILVLLTSTLLAGFFAGGEPVFAVGAGGIGVLPVDKDGKARSWFIYTANPGEVIKDTAVIINNSDQTQSINIYAYDGATTADGSFTFPLNPEENKDLGTWIKLEKDQIVLPPQGRGGVDLTVTVPETADVGEHAGGIVILKTPEEKEKGKGGLSIVLRVGARMYLTVPGEVVRDFDVRDVKAISHGRDLSFQMTLVNNGNIRFEPKVDISLRGIFGSAGKMEGASFGSVLRGQQATATKNWYKGGPIIGRFRANFVIHTGEAIQFNEDGTETTLPDITFERNVVFWLFPWGWFFFWVGVLAALYFLRLLWIYLLIRARLKVKAEVYTVKRGDTLTEIAEKRGVSPKSIARYNLMKWPYDLKAGDKLLIPVGVLSREEWREKGLPRELGHRVKRAARHPFPKGVHSPHLPVPPALSSVEGPVAEEKLLTVIAEAGDALEDIAKFAGVSVATIKRHNPQLKPPYKLKAGQELRIPPSKKSPSRSKKIRR